MRDATILVADDDASIRTVLDHALSRQGYAVMTTGNVATLWNWIKDGEGHLVISDVVMPDANGLDLIPRIKKIRPNLRVIAMSAQSTLLTAVKANERGAFDYLPKPFDLNELLGLVEKALAAPESTADAEGGFAEEEALPLIGRSPAMQEIYRVLARLMNSDLTVMVYGESGTGKELVARALHDYGKRRRGTFVPVNMAAIPRDLIESELFGHEKGAFTGASHRAAGRFEQAAGGTLFLDEIGDMPLDAQTRLLRVLQEGEYTSVGGRTALHADVRIVAATHRDLMQMVRQGLFREDLFYRLNVVPLRLPPLRERREDLPELVAHFLARGQQEGLVAKQISPEAMALLKAYRWPGNVRELENVIQRLTVLYSEARIGPDSVRAELGPIEAASGRVRDEDRESLGDAVERQLRGYFEAHGQELPSSGLYERVIQEVERPLIELSLAATAGNQLSTARLLGINRNTLRKKIRELGIQVLRGSK